MALISGLSHVNLTVPPGTLHHAAEFYGKTLGLEQSPVPQLQRETLAWFNISTSSQQIHIAFGPPDPSPSSRHPCFKIDSPEKLLELRKRIYAHFERGGDSAPKEADKPGEESSGAKGVEYPTRFFARDYAGNRLEFSL